MLLPILFALLAVRLIMTPLFLQAEYNRPGFPDDYYGFTREDRLNYAPFAIDYLLNGEDIAYLGNLNFPDGRVLYNARELQHMRDVKVVTTAAYTAGILMSAAAVLAAFLLWRRNQRAALHRALTTGALFAIGLIVAIIILAALAWDTFFTSFHALFFAPGSWYFEYSDTLIRLFPEQFWFDAAVSIGALVIAFAVITLIAARFLARTHLSAGQPTTH